MQICLLTDFGLKDGYVGTLKGVISNIAPKASIIDLSHEIEPYNILQAGFVLHQSYRYFPKGTIFVAVVDPGVGSDRKPILIKTKNYYFVGPDNGIFSLVHSEEKVEQIVHLQNSKYFLNSVSSTFHGRDIFAPVAAHLSLGISCSSFGQKMEQCQKLHEFFPAIKKDRIFGRVLSIDRFGNMITNVSKRFLEENFSDLDFSVLIKGKKIRKIYSYYTEGKKGEIFLLFGSSGFLEIVMNQSSTAKFLKVKNGTQMVLNVLPKL